MTPLATSAAALHPALTQAPGWSLFGLLTLRDPDLALHAARSTVIATTLADESGIDLERNAFWGFLLHDLGTLECPSAIVRKPGPLTPGEHDVLSAHAFRSAELLAQGPGLDGAAVVALHHHERWDGGGYPDRLMGENIPLASRVLAVADAFTAMTTRRPYRVAMPPERAIEAIRREAGAQFDPQLADVFCDLANRLPPRLLREPLHARQWLSHAERARDLSRAQLEVLFTTALGLDAVAAAQTCGRSTGTQRNWSSSLRRSIACPPRVPLPRFLSSVGRREFESVANDRT